MNPFDLTVFREVMKDGRIEWRKHALQKLTERGIPQGAVREVLIGGEMVREYAADKPFPTGLFLGYVADKPLHVVAAFDETSRQVYIITAYEPSLEIFGPDYRTKRKP